MKKLIMTTSDGVGLYFNSETMKFSSHDKDAVKKALKQDAKGKDIFKRRTPEKIHTRASRKGALVSHKALPE